MPHAKGHPLFKHNSFRIRLALWFGGLSLFTLLSVGIYAGWLTATQIKVTAGEAIHANAMAAADSVLVPMQCEYYALEGLTALMDTINQLTSVVNADLKIEGILRTMYDPRNRLANDVSEQLKQHFGDKVYRAVIPRNVRLAEAPSFGTPVMYYDKGSTGAKAYLALAGEILRRADKKTVKTSTPA